MRRSTAVAAALACALGLAGRASAELAAGQHTIIAGIGGATPAGDINVVQGADVNAAGRADALEINKRAGAGGVSGFFQYTYQLMPSLGLGVDVMATGFGSIKHEVSMAGLQPVDAAAYGAGAGGTFTTESTIVTYLAVAKWAFMPESNWNPYLMGGVGFNSATASSAFDPNAATLWVNTGTHEERELYNRTSSGFSASLGGGVQAAVTEGFLIGVEGRWNYSGVDSNDFGTKSLNSGSGYFWGGWRFGG